MKIIVVNIMNVLVLVALLQGSDAHFTGFAWFMIGWSSCIIFLESGRKIFGGEWL